MFKGIANFLGDAVGTVLGPITDSPLGDFLPGIGDAKAQKEANKQNIKLDQANRDWMERMSNTAYQRATDDMRQAGINPMLAYAQGGASAPSTTAAQVASASKSALGSAAGQALGFGVQSAQRQQQLSQQQAMNESTIKLQETQAAQNAANTAKTVEQTKTEGFTGNMAKKAQGTVDKLIQFVDSTAKKTKDRQSWFDKIKSIMKPAVVKGKKKSKQTSGSW